MKIVLKDTQLEKIKNKIQDLIDYELNQLREESEEWGMGEMDELHELQSVDKITIDHITMIGKIKVYINIHREQLRHDFDNLRAEIQYRLENWIPNIELYINEIIDNREFGPGINW